MPIFQPFTYGIPFIRKPICCNLRIMHYFLKEGSIKHEPHNIQNLVILFQWLEEDYLPEGLDIRKKMAQVSLLKHVTVPILSQE